MSESRLPLSNLLHGQVGGCVPLSLSLSLCPGKRAAAEQEIQK